MASNEPNKRDIKRILDRCISAMNDVLVAEGMMADAPTYKWFEDSYIRPNVRIMRLTENKQGKVVPLTPERVYFEQLAGSPRYDGLFRNWLDECFCSPGDGTTHRIIGLSRTNRKYPVLTMQLDEHGEDSGLIYKWTVPQIERRMNNV